MNENYNADKNKMEKPFDTFGDPELERANAAAIQFVQLLAAPKGAYPRSWLTLLGKSGTGKTHLSKRIFHWWRQSGARRTYEFHDGETIYDGAFVSWPELALQMRADARAAAAVVIGLLKEPLLIIDDAGAVRDNTGFITGELATLLTLRMDRWTVITSNLSISEVAKEIDSRVASRMMRPPNQLVSVNTKDYALRAERVK